MQLEHENVLTISSQEMERLAAENQQLVASLEGTDVKRDNAEQ